MWFFLTKHAGRGYLEGKNALLGKRARGAGRFIQNSLLISNALEMIFPANCYWLEYFIQKNGDIMLLGLIGKYLLHKHIYIDENLLPLQKPEIMLTKERLNKTIKGLPDSFTIDELIDQLIFMEKVEEGIQQSEEGKVISNEDVKIIIDKWSK